MQKLTSVELIAKVSGESREQVRRYIRLTYLIPELLKIVDDTVIHDKRTYLTLGITTAVELSYLNKDEQKLLFASIEYEDLTPNRDQAIRIRKLSQKHKLDFDSIEKILDEKKGNQNDKITFNREKIEAVLPKELLKRDKRYIEQYIIEAIGIYNKIKKWNIYINLIFLLSKKCYNKWLEGELISETIELDTKKFEEYLNKIIQNRKNIIENILKI